MGVNDNNLLFKALAARAAEELLVFKLFKIDWVFDICSSIFFGFNESCSLTRLNQFKYSSLDIW